MCSPYSIAYRVVHVCQPVPLCIEHLPPSRACNCLVRSARTTAWAAPKHGTLDAGKPSGFLSYCRASKGGFKDTPPDDLVAAVLKETLNRTGVKADVSALGIPHAIPTVG